MKKLVNGELVDMTPEEAAAFEADRTPTLPQAKRAARLAIAARRAEAEHSGFLHAAVRYDSDALSLARIAVIAERARTAQAASAPLVVTMVAADDSQSNMNAAALIALEVSAGDHFVACSDNARVLRRAVNAAADLAAVTAVDLEVGWP